MLAEILVIGIEHDDPACVADLGRGQSDARRRVHGLHHAVDEMVQAAVDIRYRQRRGLERRIGEFTDLEQGHGG